MRSNLRKEQVTVRLEPDVIRTAKEQGRRIGLPYSVVLANAAKKPLMSQSDASVQSEMKDFRKHVLSRMNAHERGMGRALALALELLALLTRAYLNHTPEVVETERDAASMSGRLRFARLVSLAQRNVHDGISILDDSETHE